MRHAALPPPLLPPPLQLLVLLHHLAPNVRNSLCTSTILGCAAGAGVCRVPLLPCRCMRCTPVSTMHGCAAGAGVCRVPLLPCRCMRCTPMSTMHGCQLVPGCAGSPSSPAGACGAPLCQPCMDAQLVLGCAGSPSSPVGASPCAARSMPEAASCTGGCSAAAATTVGTGADWRFCFLAGGCSTTMSATGLATAAACFAVAPLPAGRMRPLQCMLRIVPSPLPLACLLAFFRCFHRRLMQAALSLSRHSS